MKEGLSGLLELLGSLGVSVSTEREAYRQTVGSRLTWK